MESMTFEDLMLMTIFSKLYFSKASTCFNALSTSASAVTCPYFSSRSFSSEPPFTPTLNGIP